MEQQLPVIGAHVSSAGGPEKVFARAAELGAEAIQLFISAPQQWREPRISEEQAQAFLSAKEQFPGSVFFHGVYLINFGSQDTAILDKSVASLASYLRWADRLGVKGTIFHVGSHLGVGFDSVRQQMCERMRQALEEAQNESWLILENNAGQGNCAGRNFGELAALIDALDGDSRARVCLDTCHAYAMGYEIATPEGCAAAMDEFKRELGLDRLVAVHANDSKTPLGGVRDRHENIGDGYIGHAGFRAIMSHPAFAGIPFLLEVPGLEKKGPDAENVRRLKAIRDEVATAGRSARGSRRA